LSPTERSLEQNRLRELNNSNRGVNLPPGNIAPVAIGKKAPVVAISGVDPKGQGEQVGLKTGDIILEYAGVAIDSIKQFQAMRKAEPVGGPPQLLTVRRPSVGKVLDFDVPNGLLGIHLETR
jgi:S1-C subfamily serine protease